MAITGVGSKWKIYRSDGETLASWEIDTVFDIPREWHRGVMVIVEHIPGSGTPWVTTVGDHNYVWDCRGPVGERWFGANDFGLFDYMCEPGPRCVIFGETVDNEAFTEIFNRAMKDPDFDQPKETFTRNEIHPA